MKNFKLLDIDLYAVSACFFLAACSPRADATSPYVQPDVCQRFVKPTVSQGVLIDGTGNLAPSGFDLGMIDLSQVEGKPEYVPSKNKYQLILSPARLQLASHCNMSMCIEVKQVAAKCKSTVQYELVVALLPWKFGPGKFSAEPNLDIQDPKMEIAATPKLHFQRKVTGEIAMPWLDVKESPALRAGLEELFSGRKKSVSLEMINSGNRSITLEPWSRDSASGAEELGLNANQCSGKTLPPAQSCSLTLARIAAGNLTQSYHSWTSSDDKDRHSISLSLSRSADGKIGIDIKNR